MDNIIPFKKKEEDGKKGYIRITYSSDVWMEDEIIQADSFGMSEDLPGFIVLFREDPEEIVGFIQSRYVVKLELTREDNEEV